MNEDLQRWLLDSFAGHGFELSGPDLLVFCARLEPDGLPGLFDLAVKLRRRLEPSGPAPP